MHAGIEKDSNLLPSKICDINFRSESRFFKSTSEIPGGSGIPDCHD